MTNQQIIVSQPELRRKNHQKILDMVGATEDDIVDALMVCLAFLNGLSGVVLSGDMWALALMGARKQCKEAGLDPERIDVILDRINQYRIKKKRTNPLSGMFEEE